VEIVCERCIDDWQTLIIWESPGYILLNLVFDRSGYDIRTAHSMRYEVTPSRTAVRMP